MHLSSFILESESSRSWVPGQSKTYKETLYHKIITSSEYNHFIFILRGDFSDVIISFSCKFVIQS